MKSVQTAPNAKASGTLDLQPPLWPDARPQMLELFRPDMSAAGLRSGASTDRDESLACEASRDRSPVRA